MKYLFCVTSALLIDYGKYSYVERLPQLLSSFVSIKKYAPNSDIILFDVSYDPIPQPIVEKLSKYCKDIKTLRNHYVIKQLKDSEDQESDEKRMVRKTFGELVNLDAICQYVSQTPVKYDRVFKLTGRYRLSESFNTNDYSQLKGKLCMLHEVQWDRTIYPMRLWSFDPNMVDVITTLHEKMQNGTKNDNGTTNIIEQTFYRYVNELNIPRQTLDIVGCEGNMFDGHLVNE